MKKLVILLLSFLIVTACSDDFLDTVNKNNPKLSISINR